MNIWKIAKLTRNLHADLKDGMRMVPKDQPLVRSGVEIPTPKPRLIASRLSGAATGSLAVQLGRMARLMKGTFDESCMAVLQANVKYKERIIANELRSKWTLAEFASDIPLLLAATEMVWITSGSPKGTALTAGILIALMIGKAAIKVMLLEDDMLRSAKAAEELFRSALHGDFETGGAMHPDTPEEKRNETPQPSEPEDLAFVTALPPGFGSDWEPANGQ